jgi:hypothetical protein
MLDTRISGALGGAASGAGTGMMLGGPVGAAVGAIAGGLFGGLGGGAEKDAMRLAREQARLIRATASENQRRATLEMEQVLGGTKAAIAASNILFTGSSRQYYNNMASQYQSDIQWDLAQARMEESIVMKGGQMTAKQIRASGVASMVSGIGAGASAGVFGSYSKSGGYKPPWSK